MCNISTVQIMLMSIILKVKFSYEITLKPTTVHVTENQSTNITCTLGNTSNSIAIIDIQGEKTSTIIINGCLGEGPIVTKQYKYGFLCPNNDSIIVTLKSVQRTSHKTNIVCRTEVNGASASRNSVTVYVKVPITNVTLHQTSTILKAHETNETVIECITSAGYPTSSIHWYKNESRLLPSQYNINTTHTSTDSYLMTTRSILRMYPSRQDDSSRLFCTANNSEDNMSYSDNVTLLVYYGPDKPIMRININTINDTVDVISGHSLMIHCNSKGYPTPGYYWLTPNNSVVEGYILHIPNATYPVNQGAYKCNAFVNLTLSTGTEPKVNTTSVFVNVLYPTSILKFEVNGNTTVNVTVNETDQLIFVCTVDGKPASNVSILHKGTIMINHERVTTNISHTMTNVSCLQDGLYTCIAQNEHNTEFPNKDITVQVLCSPRPKSNKYLQKFFTGKLYDTVTISFEVMAYPAPNTDGFVWKKLAENGSTWATLENNDVVDIMSADLQSNLTLKNITRSFVGRYKLEVTNTVDTYTHEFVLEEEVVESSSKASFHEAMIAGIGCSVVVLCLFVLAIVLYKCRIRKQDRREIRGDTRPKESRASQENSQCETVFQHKHTGTNETEGTSNIDRDVYMAEPSVNSVSGRFSRSTSTVLQRNHSNKKHEHVSEFGSIKIKQKHTSTYELSDNCDMKEQESTPEETLDDVQSEYQNMDFVYENVGRRLERVQLAELFSYVTSKSYESEFKEFTKVLQFPTTFAEKTENIKLNRFRGIYPYDHSRVTVTDDPNFFMNACYINGYKKEKAYIASLGPTSDSTYKYKTFWKMVWHEKSDIIIMLTNLREVTGLKCQQYWPDVGTSRTYGDVTVTCQTVRTFAEYSVRTFDISRAGVVRPLTQLHFTAWPDQSVPDNVTSLLEFRQRIKTTYSVKAGPIIVHCSAGIGRTGTLIALDMLIDEGKAERSVNVSACVKRLREQRVNMVQTQEQYAYIHKALVYALVFECEVIYTETFQEYLESASNTFFENMFEKLHHNVSRNDEDKTRRINEQYKKINRPGADIPGDKQSIKLYLNKTPEDLDYINAVHVNSFNKKNRFITAQTPRTSSLEDFLSLIYQADCFCIVTLNVSETQGTVKRNKDVGVYLPPDDGDFSIGNFKVSSEILETNPQYIVRRVKVKHHGLLGGNGKTSYHFQYTQWDSDKCVPHDAEEFVQFIRIVDQYEDELSNGDVHTLVHCLDASERSGLFCCIANMIEKIECEGQVNIGNTIRQIRSRRMTVIQNMEQLRFCYQAVNAYINMKKTQ